MAIRNIAIIAHVDHGKTTLVDQLLKQSGTIKEDAEQHLVMDSNDQERERGITIYSKNTSIRYHGETINIIDTPWHADFWSEVERVLRMIDCVLLVVDAYEWPMPQTKFVLKKSLELGLQPIVILNKIDKPTARPAEVINMLFDLFIQLWATDDQADFPVVYASAKNGYAMKELTDEKKDLWPIFEAILTHVPEAPHYPEKPFRMQIANLGYDEYLGRLGIGRVYEWTAKPGTQVTIIDNDGVKRSGKITKLFTTLGLQRIDAAEARCGDIVTIAGIPSIFVGETVGVGDIEPMPPITIDEPTLRMEFLVNDSPFAGKEGKYMTTRLLQERIYKELETNVWLKLEEDGGRFILSGRGELHLSVLIESIRREGWELQVAAPEVIYKIVDGQKLEPIEQLIVTVDDDVVGSVIEAVANRKGYMQTQYSENGVTTVEFDIPTRGLLGLRTDFILMTRGQGIMYSAFSHFDMYRGDIQKRQVGSMISMTTWQAMNYSIFKLQERGPIFVDPAQQIYEGMIVGEHLKGWDMNVNLTYNKQLTNVRNSGNDVAMRLDPIVHLSLEDALWYIGPDELVEITPKSIRLRKKYLSQSARDLAKKEARELTK